MVHHHKDKHEEVNKYEGTIPDTEEHRAKFSHELISGAAAYEAMKAYQEHEKKQGKPTSHEKAKEIFAALAAAEVDKLIETKGLTWLDKEKAKKEARKHAEETSFPGY